MRVGSLIGTETWAIDELVLRLRSIQIMAKTLFGGGSGSATDVESLLTLHGVLCAFQ